MRVFLIGRNYQATEIDVADAAGRFIAWLVSDANPVLTTLLQRWLSEPSDKGGLAVVAESAGDLARLRAEVLAAWQQAPGRCGPDRQVRS